MRKMCPICKQGFLKYFPEAAPFHLQEFFTYCENCRVVLYNEGAENQSLGDPGGYTFA